MLVPLGYALAVLLLPTALLAPGAPPTPSASLAGSTAWVLPLQGPVVIMRAFDPPARVWLPGHRGVDLAASPGAEVRAAGPGVITWAGSLAGRGVIVVSHPDGRRTTYEPVTARVALGQQVVAGELIGVTSAGASHCGGLLACLHWGLRRGRDYLDPMRLVDPGRPVLLAP